MLTFIFVLIVGCSKNESKDMEAQNKNQKQEMSSVKEDSASRGELVEIKLPTLQCGMCKKTIETAVNKIDGVNKVNVVIKDKIAKVNYDKNKTDPSKVEEAIVLAGYQANDKPANKESYDKLHECCKIGGH